MPSPHKRRHTRDNFRSRILYTRSQRHFRKRKLPLISYHPSKFQSAGRSSPSQSTMCRTSLLLYEWCHCEEGQILETCDNPGDNCDVGSRDTVRLYCYCRRHASKSFLSVAKDRKRQRKLERKNNKRNSMASFTTSSSDDSATSSSSASSSAASSPRLAPSQDVRGNKLITMRSAWRRSWGSLRRVTAE